MILIMEAGILFLFFDGKLAAVRLPSGMIHL
jgi:hypothetical protein